MKKILYIALAFAALFAVSCQKEKELHPVGSKIVFSASTEFRNGLETRTIYTGQYTQTSPNYERIDWVANDPIKILYSHGASTSADYAIVGSSIAIDANSITGTGAAKKSTASISASGTALEWEGGNSHIFYGIYPASAGTLTAGSVTGLSIPATQTVTWNADQSKYLPTMTNAFMVAYKDMSSDPTGTVNLPFTPVVNAVEFRLHLPDDRPSYTVTQVQFSHGSTAIAGSYDVSITGFANDAVTWSASVPNTTTTKKILVNFSPANPAVPTSTSGNVLDFTILTLPVQISNPILEIKYSDGHVLKLTLSGLTLQPGQKCIVTNSKAGHDDFTYLVSGPASETITGHNAASFSQINVSSVKKSGANSNYTEPVAWKVQYNDNGTWRDGVPSGYTLSDDHTNNRFTVSLDAANAATEYDNNKTPFAAATEILRARSSVGSSSAPYDLSTHALDGTEIAQSAANCYVVTRPGVYKFPLIYGNARLLGADNPSAYSPKDVSAIKNDWGSGSTDPTQNYYLPAFYNAKGQAITSPYLITDLGLSYSDIHVHRLTQISPDSNMITSFAKGGTNATDAYITFTITPENIRPGNIVFNASYSSFSQEPDFDVAWSWHIWVTDKDLTPSNSIMPYNLGWVDKDEIVTNAVRKYTDRTVTLRIVQYETTTDANQQTITTVLNEGTSFTLTQTGDVASINNPQNGTNPHYQWGRKDPYPFSSSIELQQHADAGETTGYWYWRGIRVAWKMLKSENSTTWVDGKAIPWHKAVQTPNSWKIKTGTYGPYGAGALKDAVQGILGTSNREERKRVTGNYTSWFSSEVYTNSPNYGIPASYWSTTTTTEYFNGLAFTGYKLNVGTILTLAQMQTLSNLCTTYLGAYQSLWDWNNYPTFEGAAVENVYYYRVTSPTTITEAQYNNLISKGFPSSGIEIGYTTSYPYTTDAERALGSIFHNLWSASLYNETASIPSGGKYKTVYDPCPAGFTVPTKATYNSGTFTGYPRTGMRVNSGGTSASTTVSDSGTKGYYWTDHSCNMSYNSGAKDVITSYTDYDKSYILETTSSSASVKKNIRATAASIRPMVDPRATTIAGHATPAQVSASNSIESVTMGAEL